MNHELYMRRALQLAAKGFPYASPNPMVGAVIAGPGGDIIGEGYHRRCGGPHAEVNAVCSVADKAALKSATMYVTLEPCAHFGRTPPCAKLIIDHHIPRVVVGCRDPFDQVNGKGIEMLRQAGVEVTLGVLERECRSLNAVFFTAHTLHRPFVMLKWAQSADGFTDIIRPASAPAAKISSTVSAVMVHRLRAWADAIAVGSGTVIADNPSLTTRLWPGDSPRPVVFDRSARVDGSFAVASREPLVISDRRPLLQQLHDIYKMGITSLLVEGGPRLLQAFIDCPVADGRGLWDLARVEVAPVEFGPEGAAPAPVLDHMAPCKTENIQRHLVKYYAKNALIDVKNI